MYACLCVWINNKTLYSHSLLPLKANKEGRNFSPTTPKPGSRHRECSLCMCIPTPPTWRMYYGFLRNSKKHENFSQPVLFTIVYAREGARVFQNGCFSLKALKEIMLTEKGNGLWKGRDGLQYFYCKVILHFSRPFLCLVVDCAWV